VGWKQVAQREGPLAGSCEHGRNVYRLAVQMLVSQKRRSSTELVTNTWCDCELPGMILLRDLQGTIRLGRSKNTAVHVSTFASYDFNTRTPVVCKLWRS
jgi:hypothetical protein